YPIQETRSVTQALLSINGVYTTVYGYDTGSDTWHMYDVTAEPYANTLDVLQYGHGYWINVSQAITLYLGGESSGDATTRSLSLQSPPSSFYGPVLGGTDLTPTAGMPVTATVNGAVCAQGETILYEGDVVYALHVRGGAGCGDPGDEIVFEVDGETMAPQPGWDNSRVRRLPLEPDEGYEIYLPVVIRN
ncbi:MAG: hypothetical protein PVI59_12915, partial [Anaerolineae bacterium]